MYLCVVFFMVLNLKLFCSQRRAFLFLRCFHHTLFLLELRIRFSDYLMILHPDVVKRKCQRLQRQLTDFGLQLTFPDCNTVPPHSGQFSLLLLVTLLVPANLLHPKLPIRIRKLTTLRTFNLQF